MKAAQRCLVLNLFAHIFAETGLNECDQGLDGLWAFCPLRAHMERYAGSGGEHHQAHD
ncbi:protein of unknown function [Candidatus Filomicrobium marinum]|nr:protein of unknown function [Candidatus Filomicrobium marinum]